MKRYDYMIDVQRAVRPLGRWPYIATFSYFYELTDGPDKRVTPPVQEAWGHTSDEAREKLEAHVRKWERAEEE